MLRGLHSTCCGQRLSQIPWTRILEPVSLAPKNFGPQTWWKKGANFRDRCLRKKVPWSAKPKMRTPRPPNTMLRNALHDKHMSMQNRYLFSLSSDASLKLYFNFGCGGKGETSFESHVWVGIYFCKHRSLKLAPFLDHVCGPKFFGAKLIGSRILVRGICERRWPQQV